MYCRSPGVEESDLGDVLYTLVLMKVEVHWSANMENCPLRVEKARKSPKAWVTISVKFHVFLTPQCYPVCRKRKINLSCPSCIPFGPLCSVACPTQSRPSSLSLFSPHGNLSLPPDEAMSTPRKRCSRGYRGGWKVTICLPFSNCMST